jgi:hypothetical protein
MARGPLQAGSTFNDRTDPLQCTAIGMGPDLSRRPVWCQHAECAWLAYLLGSGTTASGSQRLLAAECSCQPQRVFASLGAY